MSENQTKSKRGGRRPGAGRKPKQDIEEGPQAASFEAVEISTRQRSRVMLASVEGKKEMPASTRAALMRESRWAVNNHGFAARVVRGIARYVVGPGMPPKARTKDSNWNKQAEQAFEDACATDAFAFDKAANVNFYQAQRLILEQIATDGDFFGQQVLSKGDRAMMRFIGAEYVGDPYTTGGQEGWIDGVLINGDHRPMKYRVMQTPGGEIATEISADEMLHFKKVHRWGYVRGVPWLCNSVQRFREWRSMLEDEQAAARLSSKVGFTITSPDESLSLGNGVTEITQPNWQQLRFDELLEGVGVPRLNPGEKLEPFHFDRPNQNFEPWINFLAREISWGVGLSPEVLWAIAGIGGANTRYVLQDAEIFFSELRQLIEFQFCRKFWRFWIWTEMKAGRLPYPGDDWWRVDFVAPQRLTVDTGRDGKLRLDLARAGLLSTTRYFNELGQDADQEVDDMIRDRCRLKRRLREISAEEGEEVTLEEIIPPAPGAAVAEEDPAEDDDDV
jgi:lambda family phage portal protein